MEESFKLLPEYKNKFEELYHKKYGNHLGDSIDKKSKEDTNNEKNNGLNDEKKEFLLEIKKEIKDATGNILKVFSAFTMSLNALGDGKDLQEAFIKINISEIRSIEESINRLSHCKEMISEFCE